MSNIVQWIIFSFSQEKKWLKKTREPTREPTRELPWDSMDEASPEADSSKPLGKTLQRRATMPTCLGFLG